MTSKSDQIEKQQAQRPRLYKVLNSIGRMLGWTIHILISKNVEGEN